MNAITITFASAADLDTARRQIDKARAYQAKGGQLGTLGCALLLRTLERATDIKTTTTSNEAAKKLAAEINAGRSAQFTPMNRAETQIFIAAWEIGHEAAKKSS